MENHDICHYLGPDITAKKATAKGLYSSTDGEELSFASGVLCLGVGVPARLTCRIRVQCLGKDGLWLEIYHLRM